MQTVHIRQNKILLTPMLLLLAGVVVGITYYVYFSGRPYNAIIRMAHLLLTAFLLYAIYIHIRKLVKNEAVLTLSKEGLEINENRKPTFLRWLQIKQWEVKKWNATYYLFIETADEETRVNISWLEKTPAEVEKLMIEFRQPLR